MAFRSGFLHLNRDFHDEKFIPSRDFLSFFKAILDIIKNKKKIACILFTKSIYIISEFSVIFYPFFL